MKKNKYVSLFNKFLYCSLAVLCLCFIFGVNDLSVKGFILHELKTDLVVVEDENRDLEANKMRLESFDNLTKRAEDLKMVSVGKVDYISINSGVVARR